jgi:hypothetical protein
MASKLDQGGRKIALCHARSSRQKRAKIVPIKQKAGRFRGNRALCLRGEIETTKDAGKLDGYSLRDSSQVRFIST